MENQTNTPPTDQEQTLVKQERFETANDFLETYDRISTGYESGFYWDDVQRALRIASGLEKWPS